MAVLLGLIARHRQRKPGVALDNGRRLGKGPYVDVKVPPIEATLQKLATFTRELRNSAGAAAMKLDWTEFEQQCQDATRLSTAGKGADAMRSYARAARALMKSIRASQDHAASDSNIDL